MHHHSLRHVQQTSGDITAAIHDGEFFQMQLLRAVSVALSAAGFEGVDPTALESLRALSEEYMLRFLFHVKTSMSTCRRTQPIPQDFTFALAKGEVRSSSLRPHLKLPIHPAVAQPPLQPPSPEEPPPPTLDRLLGPELVEPNSNSHKQWIPVHFPNLPSKHTWRDTPSFTERETEPLKIRELATQQGILAEKALRKLIAVGKDGTNGSRLEPIGRGNVRPGREKYEQIWEETFKAMAAEEEKRKAERMGMEMEMDLDFDDIHNRKTMDNVIDTAIPTPNNRVVVNYDKKYWRRGRSIKTSKA